jgi:hypothetical protein
MKRLPYLSLPVEESLVKEIVTNLPRYRGEGFGDLAPRTDWTIECKYEYNPEPLAKLDPTESDYHNSLLVWQALSTMPTSLACEGRIWSRLSHVECFKYAKERWLPKAGTDEQVARDVRRHFFAGTMTARRDDNAIARLWWSASVARRIAGDADIADSLRLITKTADIRSNIVERTMMMSRPVLARAVVEVMRSVPAVHAKEETFREFMKTLNRTGGGVVFERIAQKDVVAFVEHCAKVSLPASTA